MIAHAFSAQDLGGRHWRISVSSADKSSDIQAVGLSFLVSGTEHTASHMLGKCSSRELSPLLYYIGLADKAQQQPEH